MQRVIIRETHGSYQPMNDYLGDELEFERIDLVDCDERPIQSKKAWLKQGIKASKALLKKVKQIKHADTVILVGNYMALFALMLNKLHIINPKDLYWWGLFIHDQKAQKWFGRMVRLFKRDNVHFVNFTQYEAERYRRLFKMPADRFHYIPYGDWKNAGLEEEGAESGDYYFSGGYTNRDYEGLLEAWRDIDKPLVIIGSENNSDLMKYLEKKDIPNVKVLLDAGSEEFDKYLRGSKACIQLFKEDTGACGQTVALRCMRTHKVMIASDIAAMREYILDKRTGFLVESYKDLPALIHRMEGMDLSEIEEAQAKLYLDRFSKPSLLRRLDEMFGNRR